MAEYKKFYETDMWQEGYTLQKEVYEMTLSFPKYEQFGLGGQMRDSSNSIVANIAEAHGRFHFADRIRVLYIARGKLEETQSHLIVAVSRKYIDSAKATALVNRYESLKKKLHNAILDYKRQSNQNENKKG